MFLKKFQIESAITWRYVAFHIIYEIFENFKNHHGSSCYKNIYKDICQFVKQIHYFNENFQDISAI